MGIVANYKMSEIVEELEFFSDSIVNAAVEVLGFLGTKCVNYARTIPDPAHGGNGFQDQTGNLRSSIGFKVFVDGNQVIEDYKLVKNGTAGVEKGKSLADSVGSSCEEGKAMLVVTVGMEYAVHVESLGRDVSASSELLAEREWPAIKQKMREMVKRQMSKIK